MQRCYNPECNKVLRKKLPRKRVNPKRKFCEVLCRARYNSVVYYYKYFEKIKGKNKQRLKEWYQRNKKRQNKNVLRNYHKNKKLWRERAFVGYHRNKFLGLLPNKCHECGKDKVKVIHHKTYDFPKRPGYRQSDKIVAKYLKWYSRFLLPFCSKDCHRGYHRKRHYRNINKALILK